MGHMIENSRGGKLTGKGNLNPLFCLNDYAEFVKRSVKIIDAADPKQMFSVMYADISGFQLVNDFYGFLEGNRLLKATAEFFTLSPRTLACGRVFSDHFLRLFMIENECNIEELTDAYEKLAECFIAGQREHHPNCKVHISAGVCAINGGSAGLVNAIDNANIARKESKNTLRTRVILFDADMQEKIERRKALNVEIQAALRSKEFTYYVQPKVNLHTGKIVGVEALARWVKPDGTVVPPDEFIPIMEKNESIVELDFLIFRLVCQKVFEHMCAGFSPVPFSVNLSRVHLRNPDTAARLHSIAESYHIPAFLLEFELTETVLLDDFSVAKRLMDELRGYGYKSSVDDYGSGFTGINIWQRLDFDVLKLDKEFLSEDENLMARNDILLSATIDIARQLKITILCEGTETLEQCAHMRKLGCDIAQGYFFSKPVSDSEFIELWKSTGGYFQLPWAPRPNALVSPEFFELPRGEDSKSKSVRNSVLSLIPCGIAGFNERSGKLVFVSDRTFNIIASTKEQFYDAENGDWWDKLFGIPREDFIFDDKDRIALEYPLERRDGTTVIISMYGARVSTPELGEYVLCCFFDVTDRIEANRKADDVQDKLNLLMNTFRGGIAQVVLEGDYRVVVANEGYYRLAGYTHEQTMEIMSDGMSKRFIIEEDIPVVEDAVKKAVAGECCRAEFRIRKNGGGVNWIAAYVSRIYRQAGHTIGDVLFLDISHEKEQTLSNKRMSRFYEEIYNSADCAMIQYIADPKKPGAFKCVSMNDYAARLYGFESSNAPLEQDIDIVNDCIYAPDMPANAQAIMNMEKGGGSARLEFRIVRRDGSLRWVTGTLKLIHDSSGNLIYLGVLVDNSERKQIDAMRDMLNTVMEHAPGDVFIMRVKGHEIKMQFLTHGLRNVLGYANKQFDNMHTKLQSDGIVYEKDREDLDAAIIKTADEKQHLNVNYRAVYQSGNIVWHNLAADFCEIDADGYAVYHGIITSIDSVKKSEQEIRRSDSRFRMAVEISGADVWSYDYRTNICNLPAAERESNLQLRGRTLFTLDEFVNSGIIHPDYISAYRGLYSTEPPYKARAVELLARVKSGEYKWFKLIAQIIAGEDGMADELVGVARCIDEQKQVQKRYNELQEQVKLDSLTGLYNRAAAQQMIERRLEMLEDKSFAVFFMIDIDNFKTINDRHGHMAGDHTLRQISELIRELFPASSILGRMGGDEFALFVDEILYESDAGKFARDLCVQVRGLDLAGYDGRVLSASVGIAFARHGMTFDTLYECADKAMYRAKQSGKNNYAIYSELWTGDNIAQL